MTAPLRQQQEPPLHLPLYGASMGQAWRRFWKKGFTFAGRASRSEYWFADLAVLLLWIPFYVLLLLAGNSVALTAVVAVAMSLGAVAIVIPAISLTVRRMHDANLSGGAVFVILIPFIGGLLLFIFTVLASNPLGARFDPAPPPGGTDPLLPPPPPPAGGGTGAGASALTSVPPPPLTSAPLVPVVSSFLSDEATPGPPAPTGPAPAFPAPPAPPLFAPPPPPAPAPTAFADPGDDIDATRLSAPRQVAAWTVVLDDGRRLPLGVPLIFGRNPVGGEAYPGAMLVPVGDPTSSVSKTHAVIVLENGSPTVIDLRSTNGTTVSDAQGRTTAVAAGLPHPIDGPARLMLGDYRVELVPSAGHPTF